MSTGHTARNTAEKLDRVEKRAFELLDKYHGCAQCLLLAIQEICKLRDDLLSKAISKRPQILSHLLFSFSAKLTHLLFPCPLFLFENYSR